MRISQRMAALTMLFRDAGVAELVWTNVPNDVMESYNEELLSYAND